MTDGEVLATAKQYRDSLLQGFICTQTDVVNLLDRLLSIIEKAPPPGGAACEGIPRNAEYLGRDIAKADHCPGCQGTN